MKSLRDGTGAPVETPVCCRSSAAIAVAYQVSHDAAAKAQNECSVWGRAWYAHIYRMHVSPIMRLSMCETTACSFVLKGGSSTVRHIQSVWEQVQETVVVSRAHSIRSWICTTMGFVMLPVVLDGSWLQTV